MRRKRKSGSPNNMTYIHEIIQLEGKFSPLLVLHLLRKLENTGMLLPNLPVHSPTRFFLIPINGGGNREVGRILLIVRPRVDQLDRLALSFPTRFLGEHSDVT